MSKKLIYLTSFVLVLSLAGKGRSYAWRPNPADGAIHNDTWVNLNWVPGPNVVSHDIYLDDEISVTDGIYNVGVFTSLNHTEPIQWPVSMGGNGHSYEVVVVPEGITWVEANSLAEQNGGHLATITSQNENDFVFSLINDRQYWNGSGGPLLGGYQLPGSVEPNGGWVWVTGEPFVYSNWGSGQPNNNGNENCIHFGWGGISPKWNDLEDYYTAYSMPIAYVVEFSHRNIYVDDDAAGAGDGTNWTDAYLCLQDALAAARFGDEIRVAKGIYKPDQHFVKVRFAGVQASSDRTATFQLINWVTIKGGYASSGEPDPDARDVDLYETILSGDLNGNDGPGFMNNAENSYHIVTGDGTDQTAVLDGFIITAGNANGPVPYNRGSGIYNIRSSPTVTNCTFTKNYSDSAGAMNNDNSNPTINSCTFSSNSADKGGGAINNWRSSPTLTDCMFSNNSAGWGGGAITNIMESSPTVTNCMFSDNLAGWGGGGMSNHDASSPKLTNCTFSNNSTKWGGGAITNVTECSPIVTNCMFRGNSAEDSGGGICNASDSNPTLTNCVYSGNRAEKNGGGMYNSNSNPTLINCTFSGNTAANWGGGINNSNSNIGLTNCTIVGNSAEIGNALACDSYNQESPSILELINCIVWDGGNEIWNNDSSIIFIEYSDVQGGWSGEGGYNIDADPLFVDTDGADNVIGTEDDDLRLLPGSPCIDAGDNSVIPESIVTDVDGNPRIVNDTVDIGAYEFSLSSVSELYYIGQVTTSEDDGYAFKNTYQNLDTDFLKVGSSSFAKPPYYTSGIVGCAGWGGSLYRGPLPATNRWPLANARNCPL
ncbi:MAG TPA: right-handed parallel beta-helix repeat-containing protein [Sedimentisphaerales bacterium]|nr:right-handed parallel beta-helix repeat-containing protein [Sedimentisphaerales bacterium]